MQEARGISNVVITGAMGSLGGKVIRYLAKQGPFPRLVGLVHREPDPAHLDGLLRLASENVVADQPPEIHLLPCDLANWDDRRWREAIEPADAVIHFAWQNVWPDAPWSDVVVSFSMLLHTVLAAVEDGHVRRFVFASSNHAMGGYKDPPLCDEIGPGELRTDLTPAPGTVWYNGRQTVDSTRYGTAKVMGERVCQALARKLEGRTTFLCLRIGWCQHGENIPQRLSISFDEDRVLEQEGALETDQALEEEGGPSTWSRDLRWFKEMWLSDRDLTHLFERALLADGSAWPNGFLIVNGMSNNTGMKWSLEEGRQWLGYAPQDDVYAAYRS